MNTTDEFLRFEPEPPYQHPDETDLARVGDLFDRANMSEHIGGIPDAGEAAWNISTALDSFIRRAASPKARSGVEQRDAALLAAARARVAALVCFPSWCEREHLARGFDAVDALIFYWAADTEGRELREHLLPDMRAYARALQNTAHSVSLFAEIDGRTKRAVVQSECAETDVNDFRRAA